MLCCAEGSREEVEEGGGFQSKQSRFLDGKANMESKFACQTLPPLIPTNQ